MGLFAELLLQKLGKQLSVLDLKGQQDMLRRRATAEMDTAASPSSGTGITWYSLSSRLPPEKWSTAKQAFPSVWA